MCNTAVYRRRTLFPGGCRSEQSIQKCHVKIITNDFNNNFSTKSEFPGVVLLPATPLGAGLDGNYSCAANSKLRSYYTIDMKPLSKLLPKISRYYEIQSLKT